MQIKQYTMTLTVTVTVTVTMPMTVTMSTTPFCHGGDDYDDNIRFISVDGCQGCCNESFQHQALSAPN